MNYVNNLFNCSKRMAYASGDLIRHAAKITTETAAELAFSDPRVEKIVRGVVSLAGGVALLGTSLKLKAIRNTSDNRETTVKKISRLGVTLFGVMGLVYGAHEIFFGLKDIIYPSKENFPKAFEVQIECNDNDRKERLIGSVQSILSCTSGQSLWRDVEKEGPFRFHCGDKTHALLDTRRIYFSDKGIYSSCLPRAMVFELNNLNRTDQFKHVFDNMCKYYPSAFAETIERIEHETVQSTRKVLGGCVQEGIFSPTIFDCADRSSELSIDEFMEHQRTTPHFRSYLEDWDKTCGI